MIGGPNGSGKSTLIAMLLAAGADLGEHLNADDIAKALAKQLPGEPAEAIARRAQQEVRRRRNAALAERRDYSWETVMSHTSHIEHLAEARARGCQARLLYVAVADPLVNVSRVENRVEAGGHDVPVAAIVRRWSRSIANLPAAIAVSHRARLFDNSRAHQPLRAVADYDGARLRLLLDPPPDWLVPPLTVARAQGR